MRTLIMAFFLFITGCANSETIKNPDDISLLASGKDLHYSGVDFTGDIDLITVLQFSESAPGVKQARIDGNIIFEDCRFQGFSGFGEKDGFQYTVVFEKNLIFRNCSFEKDFNLSYAEVGGIFSLENSAVNGDLSLGNVWLRGKSSGFSSLKVSGRTKITGAIFENDASFFQAEFFMPVIFQKSVFRGSVDFRASQFYNHVVFSRTLFSQNLTFSEADFTLNADFSRMKVFGNFEIFNASFEGKTDFSDAVFYGNVESGAEFANAPLTENTTYILKQGLTD